MATVLEVARPPQTSGWHRVLAGAAMVLGGLGLIGLGGCFSIGALLLVRPEIAMQAGETAPLLSPEGLSLLNALYFTASACFLGAVILLFLGSWGLLKIIWERPNPS
jgi:hypothetical protein